MELIGARLVENQNGQDLQIIDIPGGIFSMK